MVDDVATSESPKHRRHHQKGFLETISAVLAMLTKRKAKANKEEEWKIELKKSRPKKLLSNISSKALFGHNHKKSSNDKKLRSMEENQGWGNGGVWQKEILMGGKCEPLNFSGVIYYDGNGKQLSQIPLRSPRASPLPGYLTRRTPQQTL